jgi:hypothetical protein
MPELTKAHQELFRRGPDEIFSSLSALHEHCVQDKQRSEDRWHPPQELLPTSDMTVCLGSDGAEWSLNDWSFSQLCKMAGVSKDTINRLSSKTASRALQETLPRADKPLQILTRDEMIRSIHGVSYTRLWNADLLSMVREFAVDFQPPQQAAGGGTGLYCGEQDLFAFLIDPTGWAEIDGEAFAPGFFVWNSEVGRRSVGIQTFWFQAICQNHIVWDATEVVEFSRKHTANVHDAFGEMRRIIETLVAKRDERRDGFVEVLKKAMVTRLGDDAEEVAKNLQKHGIPRSLAKRALESAERQGRFTIFSLVDALTRETQSIRYAGDRTEADQKIASLLALAMAA